MADLKTAAQPRHRWAPLVGTSAIPSAVDAGMVQFDSAISVGGRADYGVIGALGLVLGALASGCGRSDQFFAAGGPEATAGGDTGGSGSTSGGTVSAGTTGSPGSGASSSSTGRVVIPYVTTLAGNGTPSTVGSSAFADGSGGPKGQAEFSGPEGVAVDAAGNVYVGDSLNYRIRKIDPSGNVTTLAGNGISGNRDGSGGPTGTAEFNFPSGLAADRRGVVFVADANNNRIARVDPSGNVTTIEARGLALYVPSGVAVDKSGDLFVTDTKNNRVLKIDPTGAVSIVAGNGIEGYADGSGGPKGTAKFAWPTGVAIDLVGNLFVADYLNNRIRKIDPNGNVTTVAGNSIQGWADGSGGAHGTAEFSGPAGIGVDLAGNLYVGDAANNRVRKIDLFGRVTTLAGNGIQGFADGTLGPLGSAEFHAPAGVAIDGLDNVFVADSQNNRIRKIVQ